jgi:hypothetical protein
LDIFNSILLALELFDVAAVSFGRTAGAFFSPFRAGLSNKPVVVFIKLFLGSQIIVAFLGEGSANALLDQVEDFEFQVKPVFADLHDFIPL